MSAMEDLAPARCPGCGAPVSMTLVSDPLTPVYLCHSTPNRIVCYPPKIPLRIANVVPATDDELDALAVLLDTWAMAWAPSDPRLGLCEVMHCDATAVDGRCMQHV